MRSKKYFAAKVALTLCVVAALVTCLFITGCGESSSSSNSSSSGSDKSQSSSNDSNASDSKTGELPLITDSKYHRGKVTAARDSNGGDAGNIKKGNSYEELDLDLYLEDMSKALGVSLAVHCGQYNNAAIILFEKDLNTYLTNCSEKGMYHVVFTASVVRGPDYGYERTGQTQQRTDDKNDAIYSIKHENIKQTTNQLYLRGDGVKALRDKIEELTHKA